MTSSMSNRQRRFLRRCLFVAGSGVVIGVLALLRLSLWFFEVADVDDDVAAANATTQLIEFARHNPEGSLQQAGIPAHLWVYDDCWRFLQRQMAQPQLAQADRPYVLTARDNSTAGWRDVIDMTVAVTFTDGVRMSASYYEGGLLGCREEERSSLRLKR